jgi:fatty-acyl-CoA synthase
MDLAVASLPMPSAAPDDKAIKDTANKSWLRALETTGALAARPTATLPVLIDELGVRWGDAPALLSDEETLSFADLAGRCRAYTRWALSLGLGKGDVVALLMPDRPDYLAIWLGLTRTGATAALINTNLTGPSLAHSIAIVKPTHLIAADELVEAAVLALVDMDARPQVWTRGASGPGALDPADYSQAAFAEGDLPPVTLADRALHIYTSGTTGLPKAANVSHHRLLMWAGWFAGMMGAGPQDRLYNCLPLYHSVGGVVATGAMLLKGGSVVIREKFSASQFWPDVGRWDCTVFQYIGELCRYLLAAPPHPLERSHRLRLACGNGLREAVWRPFQARFAIPRILEFYAATEGTFSLYNAEGRPGAVGRVPPFLRHRFPAAIVRLDEDGQPLRNAEGRCSKCAVDEPGEAIGRIASAGENAANRFEGYTNPTDTEKKILRDVFEAGDAWMRTGDLMRIDAQGFYSFVDRMGDTFRWKGENVATAEVADVTMAFKGVRDVAVYGVEIAGADGRAGMAAIVGDADLDLDGLHRHFAEQLPAYARPVALRLMSELDKTGTFKLQTRAMAELGFDPAKVSDPLFYDGGAGYRALDAAAFDAICAGRVRL